MRFERTLPKIRMTEPILLLVLSLLTPLLFGFVGIGLLAKDTATLNSMIKEGRVYDAALAEKLSALDRAREELEQVRPKLEVIEKAIPTSAIQADLLEELFTDSVQGGLVLSAVSFSEREKEGFLTSDSFSLALEGARPTLTPFLEELEKGRLIQIELISYSQSETEESGMITVKAKSFSYEK